MHHLSRAIFHEVYIARSVLERMARAFSALHLNETDRFPSRSNARGGAGLCRAHARHALLREVKKKGTKEIHTGDEEVIYADISYTRDV